MLALGMLTNPGDEWLLPDPGYPSNRHLVRSFEGRPGSLPVYADTRFQPTPTQVERRLDEPARGLMVASPGQPHRHPAQPLEKSPPCSTW
jgi:aspartate/methionine/tyrosine aminotransferase